MLWLMMRNGYLRATGDPQALRNAIDYLLEHPAEAERMGRAGRHRVEQLMSLDCYVERLRDIVQSFERAVAPWV
ncbi:MAG: glycosyltransferase [Kouleothrix sp.]